MCVLTGGTGGSGSRGAGCHPACQGCFFLLVKEQRRDPAGEGDDEFLASLLFPYFPSANAAEPWLGSPKGTHAAGGLGKNPSPIILNHCGWRFGYRGAKLGELAGSGAVQGVRVLEGIREPL